MNENNKSSGDEDFNFLVVINEKLFTTRLGMLSKDRGLTHAQQIYRKFVKKIGPTKVISLLEANNKKLRKKLYPAPKEKLIYRKHPLDVKRIIGIRHFHETLLNEKRQDFNDLFRSIGAKQIIWDKHHSWDRIYKSPDSLQSDLLDLSIACKRFKFLSNSPHWQAAIQNRLTTWCNQMEVYFDYDNDFSVNDESIDVLLEKLEATNRERSEILGEPNSNRSAENLRNNSVYKLFVPIKDTVKVSFFNREEYKSANRKWIKKNWGPMHVEAFLRVIGLSQYVNTFRSNSVEGHALLELTNQDVLQNSFYMNAQDATSFISHVIELGELDSITILAEVSNEVDNIRSGSGSGSGAGTSTEPTESLTDTIVNFFGFGSSSSGGGGTAGTGGGDSITGSSAAQSTSEVKRLVNNVVNKYRPATANKTKKSSSSMSQVSIPEGDELLNMLNDQSSSSYKSGSRLVEQGPIVGSVNILAPKEEDWLDAEGGEDEDESSYHDSASDARSESSSQYNPKSSVADSKIYRRPRDKYREAGGGSKSGGSRVGSAMGGSRVGSRVGKQPAYLADDRTEVRVENEYGKFDEYEEDDYEDDEEEEEEEEDEYDDYENDDRATSFVGKNPGRPSRGYYNDGGNKSRASSFGEEETRIRAGSDTIAGGSRYDDRSEGRSRASSAASSFIGNQKQQGHRRRSHSVSTDSDRPSRDEEGYDSYHSRESGKSQLTSVSRMDQGRRIDTRQNNGRRSRRKKSGRRRDHTDGEEEEEEEDEEDGNGEARGEEMSYKVVMVGIVGVGKKSLMKRFGGAEFSSSEISNMTKHYISGDIERFIVKSWDDKGQAVQDKLVENRKATLPFTRKADVLMVVYDITNMLSFKYLPDILDQIINSGTTPWMSLVLVGNKLDLDRDPNSRQVFPDMAFDLCRRYGFGVNFETSAKNGTNITELLSVTLSKCEQDRKREMNISPSRGKISATRVEDADYEEGGGSTAAGNNRNKAEATFAQNIASFFGMGSSRRNYGDTHSMRAGPGTEIHSYYGEDELRSQYSSRYAPHSTFSNHAANSNYRIVKRASSAPKSQHLGAQSQTSFAPYRRGAGPPTQTSFAPYYRAGAGAPPTTTSFAPAPQNRGGNNTSWGGWGGWGRQSPAGPGHGAGPPTATSFAPMYGGGGGGRGFNAGGTQTSFTPMANANSRQRPARGSRAFVV